MKILATFLVAGFMAHVIADDRAKTTVDAAKSQDEKLAELIAEFAKAQREFFAEIRNAGTKADASKLADKNPSPRFAERFLAFAKVSPKTDAGANAVHWVLLHFVSSAPQRLAAIQLIETDYFDNPKIGPACLSVGVPPTERGEALLLKILSNNSDHNVQGIACWALGALHKMRAEWAVHVKDREFADELSKMLGKELVEKMQKGPAESGKKAEEYFERVRVNYAQVEAPHGELGYLATQELFELRNLSVGKKIPEVVLEDLEGKEVKLSSLHGQVVVLDLWTTGSEMGSGMMAGKRDLVKKMKGRPFTLVSVSFDDNKEVLQEFIKNEPIHWPHWFHPIHGGPLYAWNVKGFPTIYVIDTKGVIRYKEITIIDARGQLQNKEVRGAILEKAVESLLAEAEEK